MRSDPPNKFREKGPHMMHWDSTDEDGMNGAFRIPILARVFANCIASDGVNAPPEYSGWEHISVHIEDNGRQRTPTWYEMTVIKAVFWKDDETVVEYHPAKSDYVNIHPHVLHLWRRIEGFPTPPTILV